MTTTFFDRDYLGDLAIDNFADTDAVWLTINSRGGHLTIKGRRSKFLAAVATELDVLVIPRTDLPEVTDDADGVRTNAEESGHIYGPPVFAPAERNHGTAAAIRAAGLARIALAEYLDAHPPIDEAQVDALAKDLGADNRAIVEDTGKVTTLARRLVEAGWTKQVTS